jgi:glycerol-3-phosphate acyltransferase PlsX
VISHGSSKAASIFNAVRLAKEAIDNQVSERISGSTSALFERQRAEELQNT